jgi:hypothetical protein
VSTSKGTKAEAHGSEHVHLTLLNPLPDLSSLRISSLMSSVYVALRCGSTRPSTIGDAIAAVIAAADRS